MASTIDPKIWGEAKDAYINGTDSLVAIALKFGISKRAVEKRASDEGWAALRQGQSRTVKPKPVARTLNVAPKQCLTSAPNQGDVEGVLRRQSQRLDEVEIIDRAITSLSIILAVGMEDARGIGGIATGLCRLIELRNKLVPKTAADLADIAIALGISPEDFIKQLSAKWQERA